MIIRHEELVESDFEGTVIDIETIGDFIRHYSDSRQYKDIQIVIFGYLNSRTLQILCAKGETSISELTEETREIIQALERPFSAFNSEFERGVLFHNLGERIDFDRELNEEKFERKEHATRELGILNYDDPFFDNGRKCMNAWKEGKFDSAIAHNRACLLKERDILTKRGFRKPEELRFVR